MIRFQYRPKERVAALAALCALPLAMAGCDAAGNPRPNSNVVASQQALSAEDLAAQCGFACPGSKDDKGVEVLGVADGNASISGVASVDAFFGSVINFQAAANGVSGGIEAQLNAIRADFGIAADADVAAELDAQFKANLEGGLKIDAEPAKCEADIDATIQAEAKCDVDVKPGMVMVECKGGCDVQASADVKCDANADLKCTASAPSVKCEGSCQGSCTAKLDAAASCSGTCEGECSGNCDAYVKDGNGDAKCSGKCDGMCTGSCKVELAAEATCEGTCSGQCTVTNPKAGCEGGIKASCQAKADASVMCDGKCDGDFTPPKAKAECEASAKADAQVNVQCTPPRVVVDYQLKADANLDAKAKFRFEAALKTLATVRLPALLAATKKGSVVITAGTSLIDAANVAVKSSVDAAVKGDIDVKAAFGLGCATKELPKVGKIIDDSSTELKAQLDASTKVTAALGV